MNLQGCLSSSSISQLLISQFTHVPNDRAILLYPAAREGRLCSRPLYTSAVPRLHSPPGQATRQALWVTTLNMCQYAPETITTSNQHGPDQSAGEKELQWDKHLVLSERISHLVFTAQTICPKKKGNTIVHTTLTQIDPQCKPRNSSGLLSYMP